MVWPSPAIYVRGARGRTTIFLRTLESTFLRKPALARNLVTYSVALAPQEFDQGWPDARSRVHDQHDAPAAEFDLAGATPSGRAPARWQSRPAARSRLLRLLLLGGRYIARRDQRHALPPAAHAGGRLRPVTASVGAAAAHLSARRDVPAFSPGAVRISRAHGRSI